MSEITEVSTEARWCPVCPDELDKQSLVEPEIDGDHQYWECAECGYAWGWEKVPDGVKVEGSCAIGVPETVRKAASLPAQRAQKILDGQQKPLVQLGMPTIRGTES